jgi:RNase P subunit RPR2
LTGYLVEVAHDDSSIVRFHSLDSFFRQLTAPSTDHQWNIANISADFDHPERTAHDIVTGKSLLRLADQLDDAERNDCYRFAIWLLSDQHVKEIAALFQHADEYVREDARRRLKAMQTPESKQALKIYDDEFEQFAQKCVAIFKKAGLRASVVNHSGLHIEISRNLSMLYAKRNDPDLVNFLFAPIVRNMPNAANDSKE